MKFKTLSLLACAAIFFNGVALAENTEEYSDEISKGEVLYVSFCSVCHGAQGKGDGVSSPALIPSPPDFTSFEFKANFEHKKIQSSVMDGVAGTQMEGVRDKLGPEDIDSIVNFIYEMSN